MKKLISLLSALILILNTNISARTAIAKETDLGQFAAALGADTDYINVANYKHSGDEPALQKSYEHFLNNCCNYEAKGHPQIAFNKAIAGGSCLGISILEILVHNNIISASDIQPGALRLCDIEFNDTVDEYITAYQALQSHFEMDFCTHSLSANYAADKQAECLCEIAEKNMSSGRFFLILVCNEKIRHAVTGMGIVDGIWNYNGIDYDKCVLTLDSNHKNAVGELEVFSPESCIYVNSATMQSYIPYYDSSSENGLDISCIDDDSLLNYKGKILPSEGIVTDLSDANILLLKLLPITDYAVTITDSEGNSNSLEEPVRAYTQLTGRYYFVKGNAFHIKGVNTNNELFDSKSLSVKNSRYYQTFGFYDADFELDIKDECTIVENIDDGPLGYNITIMFNENYYTYSPHYYWFFNGKSDSNIIVKPYNGGMLLSSDSLIQTCVDTEDVSFDNEGKYTSVAENPHSLKLTAAAPVLIAFDENNEPEILIDPDKDDSYDKPVEIGDVNCDGMIDAKDASLILKTYADMSGENQAVTYLNEKCADYNGDGKLNAVDASAVLSYYADMSAMVYDNDISVY